MLECKDCCLYNTEACRYGRYALEHNMSLNCDDFIVEHNKAYQQGRADKYQEITSEYMLLTEKQVSDIRAEAINKCIAALGNNIWDIAKLEQLKEQKMCSNEKPCKHPKCNKCGTTHFMSECDYGKEQKNGKEE